MRSSLDSILAASRVLTVLVGALIAESVAFAQENARVLPKGVRVIGVRTLSTGFDTMSTPGGGTEPLAQPLAQSLTFGKIASLEQGLAQTEMLAFMKASGFEPDEAAGVFTADMSGSVQVTVPALGIGVTDLLTVVVAVPVWRAKTDVAMGFEPTPAAERFVAALASPTDNQVARAREASLKLSNAVGRLQENLVSNGFSALGAWEDSGLGDAVVAAKWLARSSSAKVFSATAVSSGMVVPTGRVDDPDVLTDIPFGDGQWDVFGQLDVDHVIRGSRDAPVFFINNTAKYTLQLPGERIVRDIKDDEKIEVDRVRARFKPGDRLELGASFNWTPPSGLVSGLGWMSNRKYGDLWRMADGSSQDVLARRSDQWTNHAVMTLGWSTVPAFRRERFPVPLEIKASLLRQIRSENVPVSNLTQIDASMFF